MTVTRWWLVRHAPVVGPPGVIRGHMDADADLSDAGALAALAARLPAGARWVSSPLLRARRTAAALGSTDPRIEPTLMEQGFGSWEGLTYAELETRHPAEAARFWADPATHRPPGGESFADVIARVGPSLDRLSAEIGEGDVVAVCHAGAIRAALAAALGIAADKALAFVVDPLSLTRLDRIALAGCGLAWRIGGVNLRVCLDAGT